MLAAPNHAWKPHTSKRKRLSCGGESFDSDGAFGYGNASPRGRVAYDAQLSASRDDQASIKKARTLNSGHVPVQASISEANVPFSAAFRQQQESAAALDRPPTVEEQQAWSSGSSQTLDLCAPSSKGKEALCPARSRWVRVVTTYGHTFVRCDEVEGLMANGDVEMVLSDSPTPSESSLSREEPNRFWDHIEGDVEMDDGSSRAPFSS